MKDASRDVSGEKEKAEQTIAQQEVDRRPSDETSGNGADSTLAESGLEDIDLSFLDTDNDIEILPLVTNRETSPAWPSNTRFETLSRNYTA